ncbi:MAG TPA: hypothetical protein VFA21_20560 [Pyrinomonadaceae bacterium]|jgi:hypothetical protein|nr:hypothetical protein [Pyrinomonadaceae bacterium]
MGNVAKGVVVKLNGVDISAKVDSVKFSQAVDQHDSTTFGTSGAHSFNAGLTNGTVQLEIMYDGAIDAQIAALLGTDNVPFEYGPLGSTVGNPKKTCNTSVAKWEPPAQVGQLEKATLELQISGAVTVTTY